MPDYGDFILRDCCDSDATVMDTPSDLGSPGNVPHSPTLRPHRTPQRLQPSRLVRLVKRRPARTGMMTIASSFVPFPRTNGEPEPWRWGGLGRGNDVQGLRQKCPERLGFQAKALPYTLTDPSSRSRA